MISLETYLQKPCATLSIPYWKAKNIAIPGNMRIVHNNDFSEELLQEYSDEPYFRLCHNMQNLSRPILSGYDIITVGADAVDIMVSVINDSYIDLQVSIEQLQSYTMTPVYCPDLWVLIQDSVTGVCVGCGIADLDTEAEELILEWIQVLPAYRGKNIGTAIVKELLWRSKEYAKFATVSGKVNNVTRPEMLYRKCEFTGEDVWHILTKKEDNHD